jgi:nucleoside-triphosphatase THEP1
MLGAITVEGRGASDRLLFEIASLLQADGFRLAGAVQENIAREGRRRADMVLHLLAEGTLRQISQDLGAQSRGCCLDPAALAEVVARVEVALHDPVDLLIVNKFGKAEIEGRGFRPLIGQALVEDIPVLVAVGRGSREGFDAFAEGMAEWIDPSPDAALAWCRAAIGHPAGQHRAQTG